MPIDRSYVDDFIQYWGLMAFSLERFGGRIIGKGFDRKKIDPFTHRPGKMFVKQIWRTPSSIRGLKKVDAVLASTYEVRRGALATLAHTVGRSWLPRSGRRFRRSSTV